MISTMGRGVLWFWATVAMAAFSFATVQEVQLPEGEGKKIIEEQCLFCHDAMLITDTRASKETWTETVEMMKFSGANLDDTQTNTLVEYLAANFGVADSAIPVAGGLPEGAGRQILEIACTECHGMEYVTDARYSKDQWQEVIDRMVISGAIIGESDVPVLLDYLSKNFGPVQ